MNEKKWEKFFYLLNDIVNMSGMSFGEKVQAVKNAAAEHGAEGNLAEFVAWFPEPEYDETTAS